MNSTRRTPLDLLERLVSFDTESSKSNRAIIEFIAAYLDSYGVPYLRVPNEAGDKESLVATIGPLVEGGIVLSGHTDVVPVTGQVWTSDPFALRVADGRAYGRGAVDMKGFLALMLALVPDWCAADLARPVHLLFSYDEEISWPRRDRCDCAVRRCIAAPARRHRRRADGARGCRCPQERDRLHHPRAWFRSAFLKARTRRQCGDERRRTRLRDQPDRRCADGGGRFERALRPALFDGIGRHHFRRHSAQYSGQGMRLQLGNQGLAGSRCRSNRKKRFFAFSETIERERLNRFGDYGRIETSIDVHVPGLAPVPGSEAESLALHAARRNATISVPFGTEAGRFQDADLPVVVCGPGSIDQAHQPDEFITLDALAAGEAFMRRLTGI